MVAGKYVYKIFKRSPYVRVFKNYFNKFGNELKHELLTIQRITAIPTNWIVLKRIFLSITNNNNVSKITNK